MSKIVFFCIHAYGHTKPTLPVVRELVHRGHEVYYYSFQEFRDRIEETGAHFVGCDAVELGMKDDESVRERGGTDILFSTELIVRSTLAMEEYIGPDLQRLQPDVIVSDFGAYWGKLLAGKYGIPYVCSTAAFALNEYSARIMKSSKSSWKEILRNTIQMPKTKKILKPLRDKGYPARNILSIVETDTIVYTSREFQPCAETFTKRYAFVGPCIDETEEEIAKTRECLIYISMGTVCSRREDFYRSCIQAFRETDYEVILAVGRDTDTASLGSVPEHIHVESFVNQTAVLKKADVFLTHCGMNSANESLYYGVPMVLFPQTPEQEGVARRIEETGAGLWLPGLDSGDVFSAVQTVLEDKTYRENAGKIADSFHRCGGPGEAAEAVLRAAGRNQPESGQREREGEEK